MKSSSDKGFFLYHKTSEPEGGKNTPLCQEDLENGEDGRK